MTWMGERGAMGVFANDLRAGIEEAARKMEAARRAGDHYGAEAYLERLGFLHRVARRHGLGPWPRPESAAGPVSGHDDATVLVLGGVHGPRAGG